MAEVENIEAQPESQQLEVTVEPTPAVAPEAKKPLTLADLRMGYVVGITEDGNFVFDVVGKEQGLLELLGLQKFAESKIKNVLDANQNQGDKLLFEVAKTVGTLAQEVSKLVNALKRPDNSLKK